MVMPNRYAAHGVKFGDTKRDVLASLRANCPMHVYEEAKSTLKDGPATFPKHDARQENLEKGSCPVHVYSDPPSTLKEGSATFAKYSTPRVGRRGSGPDVHAYVEPHSTLASRGSSVFGAERYGKAMVDPSCPVHAYSSVTSSLKTSGAVSFGSTAPRACLLAGLTRTGLIPANATPKSRRLAPIAPQPPKMEAVAEVVPAPAPPTPALVASEA